MASTADETPVALPTAQLVELEAGVSLLPPLSRRGYGPGLIVILPHAAPSYAENGTVCADGIPPPLLKWAEEGFAVVQILESAFEQASSADGLFERAISKLQACAECKEEGGVGLVVYDSDLWNRLAAKVTLPSSILAAIFYGNAAAPAASTAPIPSLQHLAGATTAKTTVAEGDKRYNYLAVKSSKFAIPGLDDFDYATEAVSHTRNLTFLKRFIRGADFDLEAIWEEHTYFEFENRSVPKTMGTMVQEPYVNHIPTLTGGIGRKLLTNFYRDHFIWCNPPDTVQELVSRTIGIDRICDEFIMSFTHNSQVDWLIPGIPPTGKKLRIPFSAVVNIRGDRLYHEHIMWDQSTVLVQLGLLPEYLPFPYALPDGTEPRPGMKFEYRVPAAGVETTVKMLDKNGVESNEMFAFKVREVEK